MNILTSQVKQKEQAVKKVQEKVDSRTEKKLISCRSLRYLIMK